MSLADAHFRAAHQHSDGWFGDVIKCKRPADAGYLDVTATVAPERRERRTTNLGTELFTVLDIVVDESTLPGGLARVDMTWEINGATYSVDSNGIQDAEGGYKCVTLLKIDLQQSHRQEYYT